MGADGSERVCAASAAAAGVAATTATTRPPGSVPVIRVPTVPPVIGATGTSSGVPSTGSGASCGPPPEIIGGTSGWVSTGAVGGELTVAGTVAASGGGAEVSTGGGAVLTRSGDVVATGLIAVEPVVSTGGVEVLEPVSAGVVVVDFGVSGVVATLVSVGADGVAVVVVELSLPVLLTGSGEGVVSSMTTGVVGVVMGVGEVVAGLVSGVGLPAVVVEPAEGSVALEPEGLGLVAVGSEVVVPGAGAPATSEGAVEVSVGAVGSVGAVVAEGSPVEAVGSAQALDAQANSPTHSVRRSARNPLRTNRPGGIWASSLESICLSSVRPSLSHLLSAQKPNRRGGRGQEVLWRHASNCVLNW